MQFARHIGRFPPIILMPSPFLRAAAALVVACLLAVGPARAAEPPPFTHAQLDQMLAPIALFPDALLSQVLMATTYPSDVALAVDWAFANRNLEGDAAVKAVQDKPWDPSVQSLVAFPQVLAMLGEKPEWVRDLGDAFLAQPGEVMDSVQFLRQKAKAAGNLASNEQQVVAVEAAPPPPQVIVVNAPPPPTQIITIAPANPQVVFVPIYNPVWAFGPWWHPAFPPFFFPPGPRWGWGWNSAVRTGIWWGVGIGVSHSLWGGVDWRRRDVNINVNHWNNINVNRRIDSRDRDVNWRHDVRNRHGVPYRDAATRDRLQQRVGDARSRDDYRGRDVQRDRAREELANRVGSQNLDRGALRDVDRSQLPQRPGTADARARSRRRCRPRPAPGPRGERRSLAIAESRRLRRPFAVAGPRGGRRSVAIAESRGERGPVAGTEPCRRRRSLAVAESRGQRRPLAAAEPQCQRRVHQSRQRAAQCRQCGADAPAGRPRHGEPAGDAAAHVGCQRAASVGGRQRAAPSAGAAGQRGGSGAAGAAAARRR